VALLSGEDRATATSNKYRKFGEIWTVLFEICERTDKQNDRERNRQTYKHADRNTSHPYVKRIKN